MRIFNQIRKILIKTGNLKDYFKYALGEIVLVVIGILIALQINTWNEERKSNKEKQLTLEILKQSFEKNKIEIEHTLLEFNNSLSITDLRIKNTGPQISNVKQSTIDSIRLINIVQLELANNLNSHILIDNKSTSLLSGDVRNLLLEYISKHSKYKNVEQNTQELMLKLRATHQKHVAILNDLSPDNNIVISPDNNFDSNYIDWLRDRETQNISVEAKWKTQQSISHLKELNKLNNIVLESLSKEIK